MKKVIAKVLCFALVMVIGFGMVSLLAPSAAAASTPVVILRATDAINPILDIYVYRDRYGTGGPFTVEFEWKCTLQRGLDATKQNTPSCFVGTEGYDENAERQPATDIKMYATTDWNKQSFTFNNVGFCYEAGNVMAANNRVRFGMWYFKGELCIKNLKITNAAGEVMYDMNADPDILQLIAQMEADNLTETDLGNLAAINKTCAFAAAKFGEGSYTAHISLESNSGSTPTEPSGPIIEDPSVTTPPATNPPATNPPATDPTETNPPATDPTETNPPATNPTETNPPATDPTETNPPATDPTETNPPATQAPTQPNAGNNGNNGGVNPVILILIGAVLVVGGVLIALILTGKIGGKKEEQ